MIIGKGYYPYPVLSDFSNDYINSEFNVIYKLENNGIKTYSLVVEFIIDDKLIEEMIQKEDLSIIIHLECPRTSYRHVFILDKSETQLRIQLDTKKYFDKIEVNGMILANKFIKIYKNENINSDIYGKNYIIRNIEKGSIIAATKTQIIEIPIDKNQFENISSVINVGLSKNKYMSVNYDNDIIIIKLPEQEYRKYCSLSNTIYSTIVMTSTILPSLIYILDRISEKNSGIDNELIWYKVIEERLSLVDMSIEDINEKKSSVEIAQMILENPIERALGELEIDIERM